MIEALAPEPPLDERWLVITRGLWRLGIFARLTGGLLARLITSREPALPARAPAELTRTARRLLTRLGVRVVVRGAPPTGPALIVANHRSYMDIPVLLGTAPAVFLAKEEIAGWPIVGAAASRGGTIFVRREDRSSRKAALRRIGETLDAGASVIVFPEGTTTVGPGCLPFRPGSFHLAAARGYAVVPVAIAYSDPRNAWVGDDDFLGHFIDRVGGGEIEVALRFGPVLTGADGCELKAEAERWITAELAHLDARGSSAESSTSRSANLGLGQRVIGAAARA